MKTAALHRPSLVPLPAELIAGYRSFQSGALVEQRARYETLASAGQKPKTMVIACCDSRAAPETIFNAGPGELFVVRNVANLVPPYAPDGGHHSTSAALEFAVQALKVERVVVMGHGRCGGIAAALAGGDMQPLSPGDFIGKWVELLDKPTAEIARCEHLSSTERQTALERLSVRYAVENLRTFPCVSALEGNGRLTLHGAWFDISSGELWAMDANGEFERV